MPRSRQHTHTDTHKAKSLGQNVQKLFSNSPATEQEGAGEEQGKGEKERKRGRAVWQLLATRLPKVFAKCAPGKSQGQPKGPKPEAAPTPPCPSLSVSLSFSLSTKIQSINAKNCPEKSQYTRTRNLKSRRRTPQTHKHTLNKQRNRRAKPKKSCVKINRKVLPSLSITLSLYHSLCLSLSVSHMTLTFHLAFL